MASTYLTHTFSGSPTSNQKGTISFWMKRSGIGTAQHTGLKTAATAGSAGGYIGTNDQFYFYYEYAGGWDVLQTSRKFRDTSAWYHIVVNWDSTLATSGDRLQIWVNGVRETNFADEVQPSQNETTNLGAAQAHYISTVAAGGDYFDGLMSHFYFIDGTAYSASAFGSTDATTGAWKINTSPSVTYGNNGFFILKDGNSLTDQSGQGNNWTLGAGTLTNTEDCPSDVFATFNPLDNYWGPWTLSNGNTSASSTTGAKAYVLSTLGMSKGKFYFEAKLTTNNGRSNVGIASRGAVANDDPYGSTNAQNCVFKLFNGPVYGNNTEFNAFWGSAVSGNNIIGCALDLDSTPNTIAFSIDGAWVTGSGTSDTDFSNALKVNNFTNVGSTNTGFYHFIVGDDGGSEASAYDCNFGNGYFGTTAISSEGTNASGIGKFEHDVPTGYKALSTKGLNE